MTATTTDKASDGEVVIEFADRLHEGPPVSTEHQHAIGRIDQHHALCERGGENEQRAEHAGRLAALLALYDDPDTTQVPLVVMQAGIELAKHYANEVLRIHGGAAISPDLRLAQRLLSWLKAQANTTVHLAMMYQRGPAALRDASTARRIVKILEEHGEVERLPPGEEIDGAPRKEAWRLRP
jgi:hypothetical protein